MMYVVDALHFRVTLQDDRIKPHTHAHLFERRVQRRKGLHIRIRSNVLVVIEDDGIVLIGHRHDRILEPLVLPSFRRAPLRFDGVSIDVVAGEPILGGNQVRRYSLLHIVRLEGHLRVGKPGATARRHRDA